MSHRLTRFGIALFGAAALAGSMFLVTSSGTASAAASSPLIGVRSATQRAGTESLNWSGYTIPGTFTGISGSWTVPTVTPSPTPTYSSTWIGIDGVSDRSLIQTGTESDFVNGSPRSYAWWEILPAAETVIPLLPVNPGDRMSATITRNPGKAKVWTITIADTTSGSSYSISEVYKGHATSAEWIEERPELGRSLATLADYGRVTFSRLTANGADPELTTTDAISMLNNTESGVISTPSNPSALGDTFSVAYGSAAPATPAG